MDPSWDNEWDFRLTHLMGCRTRDKALGFIWVNFITTEACSPEAWNHG